MEKKSRAKREEEAYIALMGEQALSRQRKSKRKCTCLVPLAGQVGPHHFNTCHMWRSRV